MKQNIFIGLISLLLIFIMISCEKDGEFDLFYPGDSITNPEYAEMANSALSQLPQEGLDLLSEEDLADFRSGPGIATRTNNYGSWYPVLGWFAASTTENQTSGEGLWIGYGFSQIEFDKIPDPHNGFPDGHFTLTSEDQATLVGSYEARRFHQWANGGHRQMLHGQFEAGTQIFFQPFGNMRIHTFMRNGNAPMRVLIRGWVNYGLAVPPVPLEYEKHFPTNELEKHYIGVKSTPGAEPIYISASSEFWLYPTATPDVLAAPGKGMGTDADGKPVTMFVNQTIAGPMASGQGRFYLNANPDMLHTPYFDICHSMMLNDTGGIWPFDLVGGSEDWFNIGGQGVGMWYGNGEPIFGNTPPSHLLPADLYDDGFKCNPYGNTDCAGYCNEGPGFPTTVYVIAYHYPLSNSQCYSLDFTNVGHQLIPLTIEIPGGPTYSGNGASPYPFSVGPFNGMMQSVVISEAPSPTGLNMLLVHFFDDGAGNTFWTNDWAKATPIDATTISIDDKLTLVGGTGAFECARGFFRNQAIMHLDTYTLDYTFTGEVCTGCE